MADLQSSDGITFKTENSQIFIPSTAIMHQMEREGEHLATCVSVLLLCK